MITVTFSREYCLRCTVNGDIARLYLVESDCASDQWTYSSK